MKILLTPYILHSDDSAAYFLSQNLIDLFRSNGDITAVSAAGDCTLRGTELIAAPLPQSSFFDRFRKVSHGSSYEEFLSSHNLLSAVNLRHDVTAVLDAIDHFQPDVIYEYCRPAALIAARIRQIPVRSFIHAGMYRSRNIPANLLSDINEVLAENRLEQVLKLTDLYGYAETLYSFGSPSLQSFPDTLKITRLGAMGSFFENISSHSSVSIYLGETAMKKTRLKKLVEDTFLGASYEVNVYLGDLPGGAEENIHWLTGLKTFVIPGCSAVIHDGNDYIFNYAAMLGIPQLIISDNSCMRSWNAFAASRNGIGIAINESEMNVSTIYENYRRLVTDDYYTIRAGMIRDELRSLGGIEQIIF